MSAFDAFVKITSSLGLPALALAALVAFLNRRKSQVDRAAVIEGITVRVAERLDKDIDSLRAQLREAQTQANELSKQLDAALERARSAEAEAAALRRGDTAVADELAARRRRHHPA